MQIQRTIGDMKKQVLLLRRPSAPTCATLIALLLMSAGCGLMRDDGAPRSQRPSNKWQISFYETAQSDGSVDLLLSPVGGDPMSVSVPVELHQTNKQIAAVAASVLAKALGMQYEVRVDRGAGVHVRKANRKQPDFALTVVRLTAQSVKVDLDRE